MGSTALMPADPCANLSRRSVALALLAPAWAGCASRTVPSNILLLRHAQAPGSGDPESFRLNDCATQRNLSPEGRVQAQRLGDHLRTQGALIAAVWSSPWCRTQDTADLAFPGLRRDEPAFASFFQNRALEAKQTATALRLLRQWRGPGVLVVVTHQVNITALVGEVPSQGAGYWVAIEGERLAVRGLFKLD